jgi:autophagy-related protein 5
MRMEQEIRVRIWEGSVPICIRISDKPPLYTMVSRHIYLPILNSLLKSYFNLTYTCILHTLDDTLLPPYHPVGLLYDLFGNEELPWKLMATPAPPGPPFDEAQVRAHFMSSIKEADCLRYGSTKRVMNLSKIDQSSLWEALLDRQTTLYWNVLEKLMPNETEMLHVPFKIYLRSPTVTDSSCIMILQDLVPFTKGKQTLFSNMR